MTDFIKKFWNKSIDNKIMVICVLLIILISSVAVIFGIICKAGDEGLLKSRYDKNITLKWRLSSFPLLCIAHPSVTKNHWNMYEKARNEINSKVGVDLLLPCAFWELDNPFPEKPVVGQILLKVGSKNNQKTEVTYESPDLKDIGGSTMVWEKESVPGAIYGITMFINEKYAVNYSVWLHEILHSLGLAHDRVKNSIMYPSIQNRSETLSEKDIKLLQKTYKI